MGVSLSLSLFVGNSGQGKTSEKLQNAINLFYADLSALDQFQFQNLSDAHLQFFGNAPKGVSSFVLKNVKWICYKEDWDGGHGVGYSPKTLGLKNCKEINSKGRGTLIEGNDFNTVSQIQRIGILVHESRHIENNKWHHTFCPLPYYFIVHNEKFDLSKLIDPFTKEHSAVCDDTNQGAYSVGYIFFRSIVNSCINCDFQVKEEARTLSVVRGIVSILNPDLALDLINRANHDPVEAINDIRSVIQLINSKN